MGERTPDMVGTGEIKYLEQTKTSTAALQFDIGLSRARGRKPWPKITQSSRLGVDAAGQPPAHQKKKRIAKKPIGNKLDGCNLQHKLRKGTIWLGTWNVQGIKNKTGEIIKGLVELNQDITKLTETKKKGNGVETLGPYIHFYSGVSKEKEPNKESLF